MGFVTELTRTSVVLVSTVFGVFCFKMPNLTMEAKYPAGFRVFIPDERGIEEFGFNANINEPLESYEAGEISAEIKRKTGHFWIFQDDDIGLEPGDSLYYWTYVVFRGVVYKKTRQKWVCINFVREFSNITLPRRHGFRPKVPPVHHPFRPFTPYFPWLNATTKPPLPPVTTKRSVEVTTPTSPFLPFPPSSSPLPQTTTTPATTVSPKMPEIVTTTKAPEPETTTVPATTVPNVVPEVITTTTSPAPETTTADTTTIPGIVPKDITTTRIPEPETTTILNIVTEEITTEVPTTVEATTAPETALEVTTTRIPEPETTTARVTTVLDIVPEVTTVRAPESTTVTVLDIVPQVLTTRVPEVAVTSGSPEGTPDFCNETTSTTETISTTMSDVTVARPYAPPVYWPSNREDCLNVWSPSYRPFMTTLKITKSVILLECQVMSQKRKMTRVRSELFNLSKFNYEMEARLEALERKVFANPEVITQHEGESI